MLGPSGVHIEVMDPDPACLARWSRWVRRVHRTPAANADPLGYLRAVNRVLRTRAIDVLLPTHEQAWLFAVARPSLGADVGLAVASVEAFDAVQSKIAFAGLLDRLGIPQPAWRSVVTEADLPDWPFPYFLKDPFSTAGQGVREVSGNEEARRTLAELVAGGSAGAVMAQRPARGRYGQVQVVARHGEVVAAHTSAQTAVGVGQSAAGRISVDHPVPRRHAAMVCRHLAWHGGLTLDYFFDERGVSYLECNPRTVEPANAARSGVDLPQTQIDLSTGRNTEVLPLGRPGVRTHSAMAVILGTADRTGRRASVIADLVHAALGTGPFQGSVERLTPVLQDPPSLIPLTVVVAQLLVAPSRAKGLAASTVANYCVTARAIDEVLRAGPDLW